jgi:hypothetical protein
MRPLNECAQSNQGVLDRTHAKECTVCDGALVRTRAHGGSVLECATMCARLHSCKSVCVNWVFALKPT